VILLTLQEANSQDFFDRSRSASGSVGVGHVGVSSEKEMQFAGRLAFTEGLSLLCLHRRCCEA